MWAGLHMTDPRLEEGHMPQQMPLLQARNRDHGDAERQTGSDPCSKAKSRHLDMADRCV